MMLRVLVMVFLCVPHIALADSRHERDPLLVAHRGLMEHAPENTLPAFIACATLGFGIELDVYTTADGHLVVTHNGTPVRTAGGPNRRIGEMTLDELRELDAGSWFDARFAGVGIPTFEESLAAIRQHRRQPTILAINIKGVPRERERDLVELVERYELLDESFAFDQDEAMSRRLKAINPRLRIGHTYRNPKQDMAELAADELADVILLGWCPSAEQVAALKSAGKQVIFNFAGPGEFRRHPPAWDGARNAGVDGIMTDFPIDCADHWRRARSEP